MSGWGTLDNVAATGTVTTASGSATVSGFGGTAFTTEIEVGNSITIASNKYRVTAIASASSLTIDPVAATTSANVTGYIQQGPKFVQNTAAGNVYTVQNIYGVSADEVTVAENKARGFNQPGWANYVTYTDAYGQTRYKTETLVAMSKNFNENSSGTLQTDADDDAVLADYRLYFTTQPSDTANGAANVAILSVVAASDPTGATLTYQWSKKDNATATVYTNLANGGNISGATSNTLTIAKVGNVNGNIFRVTISATGTGADSNVSTTANVYVG